MAEPLSFAASIIAIVQATQAASQALIAIRTYYGDIKNAPETARKLAAEIKSLEEIINQMKKYGEENKQSTAIQNLEENLTNCSKLLKNLQLMLYTARKGKVSKLDKVWRSLKQAFNKKEIADIISQIQNYKETFSLGLAVENISIARNVEACVQHIAQEQHVDRANAMEDHSKERWKKILHWVFAGPTRKKHIDIAKRRRKGTGKWFLQTPGVQNWITEPDSPIVWGHGIPGSGKTFLSSAVIDHVENEDLFPATENGVAHIYFDYKDQEQQNTDDVLSSLVKQLACQLPLPLKELEELYKKKESKDRRPTTEELFAILLIIFTSFNRVFLIFDALDESDQLKEILPLIKRMSMNKVNVLVTSRPYPEDIRALLRHGIIKVEILAKEEDIITYIEEKIDENPRAKRLVELGNCREKIISELVECAKGMFLLVHFHVKYICEQTTPNEILEALEGLRSSSTDERPLDPTYNRAIKTLNGQRKNPKALAINILSWLLKARRPLTVDEIRTAARLEPGKHKLDELDLPGDETLLDVCAGLVMIDEVSRTIKFVHYTVQEYILNNDIIPHDIESTLAVVCVTYLLFEIFEVPPKTEETTLARLESHPFLRYIASHISFHVGIRENDESVTNIIMRFLKKTGNVLSFLRACDNLDIVSFLEHREIQVIEELEKWEALCITCRIGHHGSTKILIDDGADVLKSDKLGRTPLYFAVYSGVTSIAQLLLDAGAETSPQTLKQQRTPLIEGATNGHLPIVKLLLDKGADATSQDQYGWTALHHAAYEGYCEIAQLLVKNDGVKISAQEEDGWTALHLASQNGHLPVVQLLLDKGADFSDRLKSGASVLYIAAEYGHLPVVQLLLDKGADASDRMNDGTPVLYIAAEYGHLPVVQLLLDKGADASDRDDDGASVLYAAAQNGHLSVVQLLLDKGADVSDRKKNGASVLFIAAQNGHLSVVQLLLDKGADVSDRMNDGTPVIQIAALNGHLLVVQLLLDKGADASGRDNDGASVLYAAAQNGHLQVVQLLLDKGADASDRTNDGTPVLYMAAQNGHLPVVQLLLDKGADASDRRNDGWSVIHIAAQNGHLPVVQLLLDKGADVSDRLKDGASVLYIAAEKGHQSVVQLLLDKGADVSDRKNDGTPVLYIAAQNGHLSVVQLLLDKGADVSDRNNNGVSVLFIAVENGHLPVVQLLLDKGADVSDRMNDGALVLYIAAQNGHLPVVQLLLDKGADFSDRKNDGTPVLYVAAQNGHLPVVQLLLDKGADASDRTNAGWSVIHIAAHKGHLPIAQLLLKYGADMLVQGPEGITPLQLAESESMIQLLTPKTNQEKRDDDSDDDSDDDNDDDNDDDSDEEEDP